MAIIISHPLQNQPRGAILAILPYLVAFQHMKNLVDATFSADVFRIKDVAQFFGSYAIKFIYETIYFVFLNLSIITFNKYWT